MTNILHIIDTLWLGGAQQVVRLIAEKSGDHHHVLVLRRTPEMINIEHPNIYLINTGGKWDFPAAWKGIRECIQRENIKILHCHLPKSQTLGIFTKKRFPNLHLIFHEQGDIMDAKPNNLPAYWLGKSQIDKVICCSKAVKNAVEKKTPLKSEKIAVIYNPPAIIPGEKPELPDSPLQIGFAGRITKHKGWRDLLSAISLVATKFPDTKFQLHIAGVGPDESKLTKALQILPKNIRSNYHGMIYEMANFYHRLHILIVPSHREPVGMVHLEGMLCGAAIIATDVPGMNEVLVQGKNAMLVPPKSPGQLATAIENLMDTKTRTDLVANAHQMTKPYLADQFLKNLLPHYQI
ncbi:MAG: glycosyltransferase family 4 protein [Cryomorphaceae bacterium]|nr:glycosyltransferase family 4 protein [Cryomorphaceae bacterium]